jgi:GT2 family glycosyltransferase
MSAPRVRVIVVNYKGGAVTLRCLDALARTEWPDDAIEVVLVDNASSDGVVDSVRANRPRVRVIASDINEGFGRACNRAMQDLSGIDHVALVNDDAVPEPDWLSPLVDAVQADPSVGAACPKILLMQQACGVVLIQAPAPPAILTVGDVSVDGSPLRDLVVPDERFRPALGGRPYRWSTGRAEAGLWWKANDGGPAGRVRLTLTADRPARLSLSTRSDQTSVSVGTSPAVVELALPNEPEDVINSVGGVLYEGWFGGDRGYLELDRGQYDEPAEVFSWSGAGVLLRGEYLHDVGLFNPAFFLYYEDFELSWRGRLKGWRYVTAPASVLRHEHGFTTDVGSDRFRRWEARSRRLTLIELAPAGVALRAAAGGLRNAALTTPGRVVELGSFVRAGFVAAAARPRLTPGRSLDAGRWIQPRAAASE